MDRMPSHPVPKGECVLSYASAEEYQQKHWDGNSETAPITFPRMYEEWKELCRRERAAFRQAGRLAQTDGRSASSRLRDRVALRQHGCCFWCGRLLGEHWHLDHHIPRCRGGSQAESNTTAVCITCNQRKGRLLPAEFAIIMSQEFF